MEDGQRQFTAIHVAGDFVDLHSFLLTVMDHSVIALSECRIGIVPHSELRTITETHPHLARMLWLTTLIDGAIHREWLVARARRTAEQQLAHLICELYIRSRRVGVAGKDELDFPLTQSETADVLGLSAVHLNRVLQSLRREDILVWRSGRILIGDFDELARRAEFDPTYLNLETKPL
jgi:CRP-like cAMP-binding protein